MDVLLGQSYTDTLATSALLPLSSPLTTGRRGPVAPAPGIKIFIRPVGPLMDDVTARRLFKARNWLMPASDVRLKAPVEEVDSDPDGELDCRRVLSDKPDDIRFMFAVRRLC